MLWNCQLLLLHRWWQLRSVWDNWRVFIRRLVRNRWDINRILFSNNNVTVIFVYVIILLAITLEQLLCLVQCLLLFCAKIFIFAFLTLCNIINIIIIIILITIMMIDLAMHSSNFKILWRRFILIIIMLLCSQRQINLNRFTDEQLWLLYLCNNVIVSAILLLLIRLLLLLNQWQDMSTCRLWDTVFQLILH